MITKFFNYLQFVIDIEQMQTHKTLNTESGHSCKSFVFLFEFYFKNK